jgi:hypothetical protein
VLDRYLSSLLKMLSSRICVPSFPSKQYYDHPALEEMIPVLDQALQDLGQRLAQRFGGRIVP